ncbi:MAG: PEP-CTERM sorting domain-containing protein [Phycisphaerae bacterium]|jgi:T5SS/PEP-CTERM-associated repeat protein
MKKTLLVAVILLAAAANSFGWAEWNYAGGDHSWNTAANWGGAVPTASDDPIMRDAGTAGYAEVGSGVNAVGNMMWMYGGGVATLNVNGGSLALGQLRIGVDAGEKTVNVSDGGTVTLGSDSTVGQGGNGTLTVSGSGSSVNQTGGWMFLGMGGSGNIALSNGAAMSVPCIRGWTGAITVESGSTLTLNGDTTIGESGNVDMIINGGTVNQTAGWMYVGFGGTGSIEVGDGGLLSVISLSMDNGATDSVDISGTGAIEIKDARPEDIAYQMNWYAGNGWLTANGESAVGKLFFAVDENGFTTVTIPEPATLALLAIGSSLLIRRKK